VRRVNGEVKGRQIWLMYCVYIDENRTMKPTEIVLRRGEGIMKNDEGVNIIEIHC
jgi:hypothetical protein